jgi:hypothetical protein
MTSPASAAAINVLADSLEQVVCSQLSIPRPSGVLRRMKVAQLVNNANKGGEVSRTRDDQHLSLFKRAPHPSPQIEYNQACSYFNEHASNPSAYMTALSRLQSKGRVLMHVDHPSCLSLINLHMSCNARNLNTGTSSTSSSSPCCTSSLLNLNSSP